jgi:hypothetical protein
MGANAPRLRVKSIVATSCAGISLVWLTCQTTVLAGDKNPPPLATTAEDFFQPGTQPLNAGGSGTFQAILDSGDGSCKSCHGNFSGVHPDPESAFEAYEPHGTWTSSMMAQSARDPLFHAGMVIANQDVAGAGEYCMRCHVPVGWIRGNATIPDGSALEYPLDYEGVQCNFCHRMVDPQYKPGISPSEDQAILDDLALNGLLTPESNNARYTIDPTDVRRGPFFIPEKSNPHPTGPNGVPEILESPFHTKGEFCWTCHGVSNVIMSRQQDGTYTLNNLGEAHPTQDQIDMFPLHRTYNEWKNSYYSTIGVQHNGRFGGNHLFNKQYIANGTAGIMKECQDCHMPDQAGFGCNVPGFEEKPNVPQHSFVGSNHWVINAVRTVDFNNDTLPDFPDADTGLNDALVNDAFSRTVDFLGRASDLTLAIEGSQLKTRVINRTGHKLPTGFPDGRRIWINVKFFDCLDQEIGERGVYDFKTATLDASDTKVYECHLGIVGAEYAAQVGKPEGETFHFMVANAVLKDNRIPPTGHSNFLAIEHQTVPVGATYPDGQHWDDTFYALPQGARKAVVTVYYQVTSKEFIEFLRDANTTDSKGQVVYDQWIAHGMAAPVTMDSAEIEIFKPADFTQDGVVDVDDLLIVINAWGNCLFPEYECPGDVDGNDVIDVDDLLAVINAWGGCP